MMDIWAIIQIQPMHARTNSTQNLLGVLYMNRKKSPIPIGIWGILLSHTRHDLLSGPLYPDEFIFLTGSSPSLIRSVPVWFHPHR